MQRLRETRFLWEGYSPLPHATEETLQLIAEPLATKIKSNDIQGALKLLGALLGASTAAKG